MSTTSTNSPALLSAPKTVASPQANQIVQVARTHGVSPLRQLREMSALRLSSARLGSNEYYASGAFDPRLSMAEKREFVGVASNRALNQKMSPLALVRANEFVTNKVLYTSLLDRLGLATTRTQAIVYGERRFGGLTTLTDPEAVADFLINDARYPLFGKPNEGTFSVGSILIKGVDRDARALLLGNGKTISIDRLCREVVGQHLNGYLFQNALEQHESLTQVAGPAIGTVRLVTICDGEGPRPLYAVWKIPSPEASSDNFWQAGSMIAALDVETGHVLNVRTGNGAQARDIATHPVSGEAFDQVQIPKWATLRQLAQDAHMVFPEFGILGFDIAVTSTGPAIVECNDNPFHMLYQLAHQRGVRNADFLPAFERATGRASAILARRTKAMKSWH